MESEDRIGVFSADGEDDAADLAVRDTQPAGFWVLEGTRLGRRLRRTEVTNTRWEGMTLRPATGEALQEWFEEAGRALAPGDRLLIFVTDHGTGNDEDPNNGAISMWKEKLTVLELKGLISHLQPGVRAVMRIETRSIIIWGAPTVIATSSPTVRTGKVNSSI